MPRRTVTIITEAAAFGGSVVHTFGLIEALVRRGAAVEVVANRFDPYTGWVAERELGQSVRVIPTELPGITPEEPAAMDTWRTLLATLRGELLIFPKGHFYHGQLPLLRAFRKKFKSVVFIEHLEAPPKPAARERPLFGFLPSLGLAWRRRKQRQRAAARCADLVIAVSSKVRDRLVRDWDASPDEIVVVRNGVRWQDFQRDEGAGALFRAAHGIDAATFVFGMMTRLTGVKGIDLALEAARRTLDLAGSRAFMLVIAGEGPDHEALKALAEELGLGRHVMFVGPVARPLDALSAFDVILFSSRFEGLPLALLEGMAAACIPIVTQIGGMGEAVDSREVGWLVPPEDPTALALAMHECLAADAARIAAMRAHAAHRVRAEFDGDACYERILDLCGVRGRTHDFGVRQDGVPRT